MTNYLNSTLPEQQPKRGRIFSIRLTEAEQSEIDTLAQGLNLPSSFMARYFILEAVAHHKRRIEEVASIEAD